MYGSENINAMCTYFVQKRTLQGTTVCLFTNMGGYIKNTSCDLLRGFVNRDLFCLGIESFATWKAVP